MPWTEVHSISPSAMTSELLRFIVSTPFRLKWASSLSSGPYRHTRPVRWRWGSSLLCPVQALDRYLKVTNNVTCGPLFLHAITDKPLAKSACSRIICAIIKDSQPGSFPKGHDLRKMATSLAFFRDMHLSEICQRVGWASANVFIKYYLKDIRDCQKSCVVLGTPTS